ncbi:MAG: GYD domain-containing protein [bacterium]|nr:GYD domain-containing protein [bacterium]
MPRYLIHAQYTAQGLKGLLNEGGSGRREAVRKATEAMGARLEAFYFAFGDDDTISIVNGGDNVGAAAASLTASASGAVRTKVTVLLTPEEIDEAVKRNVIYRPPGG